MAAAIFRSLAKKHPKLRHVEVDSAGTDASDGEGPFAGAIKAMEEIDLDIREHRARQMTREVAAPCDLILTMDRSQAKKVRELGARGEVAALGDYAGIPGEVEPPWDSREECTTCRDHLRQLVAAVVRRLERKAEPRRRGTRLPGQVACGAERARRQWTKGEAES